MKQWTAAETAQLRHLASQKLSAQMIGERMGRTRNACIGAARRSGIELSYKRAVIPGHAHRREMERERIARKRRIAPPSQRVIHDTKLRAKPVQAAKPVERLFTLTLLDLQFGMCKYPQGDGPFVFCGFPVKKGYSYCSEHTALCYNVEPPCIRRVA